MSRMSSFGEFLGNPNLTRLRSGISPLPGHIFEDDHFVRDENVPLKKMSEDEKLALINNNLKNNSYFWRDTIAVVFK